MSTKPRVAALEGWHTMEPQPHLIGTQCEACGTYFFPKQSDYCRNPNFAYAVRRFDSGHGTRTRVIDDFLLEVNSNDGHPTAACNRSASARLVPALREARARREAADARTSSRP